MDNQSLTGSVGAKPDLPAPIEYTSRQCSNRHHRLREQAGEIAQAVQSARGLKRIAAGPGWSMQSWSGVVAGRREGPRNLLEETAYEVAELTLSLRTYFRKKRALRSRRDIGVLLFDEFGRPVHAILVDASDTGVRLACGDKKSLATAASFLIVEKAQAYELRFVWRLSDNAGFRILRSGNVRGYVDPVFHAAKIAWEQQVALEPSLSSRGVFGTRSSR